MNQPAELDDAELPDMEGVVQTLRSDGSLEPEYDPRLSDEDVVGLYRHMSRTRQLDQRLVVLQRQGRIGFHVGSLGEEGAICGSTFGLREQDWVFPCYREFGSALMRGFSFQRFIDNLFGNANDVVLGRQMPDHITCREKHFASVSSPVGTQITQAVGFAWGAKIRREDVVALVYFGDGATSSSDFHSGMNFAGVFKVPAVLFCRNNGWAISVPTERQTASKSLADKGLAYGVVSVRVDGNDPLACVWVTQQAVARASRGEGATYIEALTYRMGGHTTSDDPDRYRGQAALVPWRRRDPIERLKRHLVDRDLWSDAEDQQLELAVESELREAIAAAEATPPPPVASIFDDVYSAPPWHLTTQREELLGGCRAPAHKQ
jgi:2-oxoisovalerate dehydrogenase E1 component alpha subunit